MGKRRGSQLKSKGSGQSNSDTKEALYPYFARGEKREGGERDIVSQLFPGGGDRLIAEPYRKKKKT